LCPSTMVDPPPSPTPTVFNTPQQTTTAVVVTPPPVAQIAGASLTLEFQTPSTQHSASAASSRTDYEEEIAAGTAAAAADIDDSSLRLPFYLLNLAGRNESGINLSSVMEEASELGDGGDSDVEGDDAREHHGAMNDSLLDKDINSSIEEIDAVKDSDEKCVVLARGAVLSAPAAVPVVININIPDTPTDWMPPVQKTEKGEPTFAEVDNPGGWLQYIVRPEFGTTASKHYKRHSLPTGAQPVPANPEGKES
jgi:hypothetical protein